MTRFMIFFLYVFCSSQFGYHDLLLTVLWEGVVHTSAQVRAAAGRLFEVSLVFGVHVFKNNNNIEMISNFTYILLW